MQNFMNYNFNIKNIVVAIYVGSGEGSSTHTNRPSHGLALSLGGEKVYDFGDRKLLLEKGGIIYLPRFSNYTVISKPPGDCFAINFNIDENITFDPFVLETKNTQIFLESFKHAERVWRSKDSGYELKCKSELYNIIYNMFKEYELGYVSKSKSLLIKPAIDYIHDCYTKENISIPRLAHMCNMSETYFRQIFLKFYGVSPLKYINQLKIERAKELITSKMYSVNEISLLSGFFDTSYFCREFKKATGVTPSEYSNNE